MRKFNKFISTISLALGSTLTCGVLHAAIIQQQNFDDNAWSNALYTNNSGIFYNGEDYSFTGANQTQNGSGWAWDLTWSDTLARGQGGPAPSGDADLLGITRFRDTDSPYGAPRVNSSGLNHFNAWDTDGTISLNMGTIDTNDWVNLTLDFDIFLNVHNNRSGDGAAEVFLVSANGETIAGSLITQPTSGGSSNGLWQSIHLDLSGYDHSGLLDLSFEYTSDGNHHPAVFLDTIKLRGDFERVDVPTPATFALFLAGLIGLLRTKRSTR